MSEFITLNKETKQGNLRIHRDIILSIVQGALDDFKDGVSSKRFKFHRPTKVIIKDGIVHVKVSIDVKAGISIQEISMKLQKEITNRIFAMTDQVPFDIQVKAESII